MKANALTSREKRVLAEARRYNVVGYFIRDEQTGKRQRLSKALLNKKPTERQKFIRWVEVMTVFAKAQWHSGNGEGMEY